MPGSTSWRTGNPSRTPRPALNLNARKENRMKTHRYTIPIVDLLLVLGLASFAADAAAQPKPNVFEGATS